MLLHKKHMAFISIKLPHWCMFLNFHLTMGPSSTSHLQPQLSENKYGKPSSLFPFQCLNFVKKLEVTANQSFTQIFLLHQASLELVNETKAKCWPSRSLLRTILILIRKSLTLNYQASPEEWKLRILITLLGESIMDMNCFCQSWLLMYLKYAIVICIASSAQLLRSTVYWKRDVQEIYVISLN